MRFIERLESEKRQKGMEAERRKEAAEIDAELTKREVENHLDTQNKEKERLLKLQAESKLKLDESGTSKLLESLLKISAIHSFRDISDGDGRHHCRVWKFDEEKYNSKGAGGGGTTTHKEEFFNIIVDSNGLIIFEYATILRRHKKIEQSVWKVNPDILENTLEKAYKSPIRKITVRGPSGTDPFAPGFGGVGM